MDDETTLLLCPFCKGEAEIYSSCEMAIVECKKCHVHTKGYTSASKAIAAWNTRAELVSDKKLITIALQLVRDHYYYAERFDESCIELEQWCYDHGETDLMEYAMALRCPACAFVPMNDVQDGQSAKLTAEQVRDAVLENFEETHETRYDHWEPSKFDWQAIADELNDMLGKDRHPYEQGITGDGSDWGEIMRDAYDDLMAAACESCTTEQMEQLADYIRAELGSGTCEDVSVKDGVWKCSECGCTVEEEGVDWGCINYCPDCGKGVK